MRRLTLGIALMSAATLCWRKPTTRKLPTRHSRQCDNIYVANANGTNPVSVYRSNKVRLDAIDMAPINPATPTIRRIAFSQSGVLKVLSYEVLPGGIRTIGVTTLDSFGAPYQGADDPDFSPDGSKILYMRRPTPREWLCAARLNSPCCILRQPLPQSALHSTQARSPSHQAAPVAGRKRICFPARRLVLQLTLSSWLFGCQLRSRRAPVSLAHLRRPVLFLLRFYHSFAYFDVARTLASLLLRACPTPETSAHSSNTTCSTLTPASTTFPTTAGPVISPAATRISCTRTRSPASTTPAITSSGSTLFH